MLSTPVPTMRKTPAEFVSEPPSEFVAWCKEVLSEEGAPVFDEEAKSSSSEQKREDSTNYLVTKEKVRGAFRRYVAQTVNSGHKESNVAYCILREPLVWQCLQQDIVANKMDPIRYAREITEEEALRYLQALPGLLLQEEALLTNVGRTMNDLNSEEEGESKEDSREAEAKLKMQLKLLGTFCKDNYKEVVKTLIGVALSEGNSKALQLLLPLLPDKAQVEAVQYAVASEFLDGKSLDDVWLRALASLGDKFLLKPNAQGENFFHYLLSIFYKGHGVESDDFIFVDSIKALFPGKGDIDKSLMAKNRKGQSVFDVVRCHRRVSSSLFCTPLPPQKAIVSIVVSLMSLLADSTIKKYMISEGRALFWFSQLCRDFRAYIENDGLSRWLDVFETELTSKERKNILEHDGTLMVRALLERSSEEKFFSSFNRIIRAFNDCDVEVGPDIRAVEQEISRFQELRKTSPVSWYDLSKSLSEKLNKSLKLDQTPLAENFPEKEARRYLLSLPGELIREEVLVKNLVSAMNELSQEEESESKEDTKEAEAKLGRLLTLLPTVCKDNHREVIKQLIREGLDDGNSKALKLLLPLLFEREQVEAIQYAVANQWVEGKGFDEDWLEALDSLDDNFLLKRNAQGENFFHYLVSTLCRAPSVKSCDLSAEEIQDLFPGEGEIDKLLTAKNAEGQTVFEVIQRHRVSLGLAQKSLVKMVLGLMTSLSGNTIKNHMINENALFWFSQVFYPAEPDVPFRRDGLLRWLEVFEAELTGPEKKSLLEKEGAALINHLVRCQLYNDFREPLECILNAFNAPGTGLNPSIQAEAVYEGALACVDDIIRWAHPFRAQTFNLLYPLCIRWIELEKNNPHFQEKVANLLKGVFDALSRGYQLPRDWDKFLAIADQHLTDKDKQTSFTPVAERLLRFARFQSHSSSSPEFKKLNAVMDRLLPAARAQVLTGWKHRFVFIQNKLDEKDTGVFAAFFGWLKGVEPAVVKQFLCDSPIKFTLEATRGQPLPVKLECNPAGSMSLMTYCLLHEGSLYPVPTPLVEACVPALSPMERTLLLYRSRLFWPSVSQQKIHLIFAQSLSVEESLDSVLALAKVKGEGDGEYYNWTVLQGYISIYEELSKHSDRALASNYAKATEVLKELIKLLTYTVQRKGMPNSKIVDMFSKLKGQSAQQKVDAAEALLKFMGEPGRKGFDWKQYGGAFSPKDRLGKIATTLMAAWPEKFQAVAPKPALEVKGEECTFYSTVSRVEEKKKGLGALSTVEHLPDEVTL